MKWLKVLKDKAKRLLVSRDHKNIKNSAEVLNMSNKGAIIIPLTIPGLVDFTVKELEKELKDISFIISNRSITLYKGYERRTYHDN